MGVKSTTHLTRAQAEERFVDAYLESKRSKGRSKAAKLSDTELEDILERWNDERFERDYGQYGGFDNFLIVQNPDEV